ncbi:hypothetical protein HMPREF9370_1552 [Neisseria wadsworthii 9715]|uniref:Uncharacterized protein n=1 Tax=Neisseria wadsworthii 9715 TaxID=1030841 RepID=G4CR42_9NEIS|nr:hypothetical protein HMPREF9370_1552 [Neisseria wadsworthii 9715]
MKLYLKNEIYITNQSIGLIMKTGSRKDCLKGRVTFPHPSDDLFTG